MLFSMPVKEESFEKGVDNNELTLTKIDILPSSMILDIFEDIRSECEQPNKGNFFSLHLNDYRSGEKAYIVQELNHQIDKFQDVLGYTLIRNDTIIIYGKLIPDFRFSYPPSPIRFPVKKHMRSDYPEWVYFINDGIFARDGESMGWIWHIPKDSLKCYDLNKYTITSPNRTKK